MIIHYSVINVALFFLLFVLILLGCSLNDLLKRLVRNKVKIFLISNLIIANFLSMVLLLIWLISASSYEREISKVNFYDVYDVPITEGTKRQTIYMGVIAGNRDVHKLVNAYVTDGYKIKQIIYKKDYFGVKFDVDDNFSVVKNEN